MGTILGVINGYVLSGIAVQEREIRRTPRSRGIISGVGNKHVFKRGGELADYPGWFMIEGGSEDGSDSWSVVRRSDGSWWWVAATDIFPPTGGMQVDLGGEITDEE